MNNNQLRNYIPISGPATRAPCDGTEGQFRVSIGFTPRWFHQRLGIDFSEIWHKDPLYRYDSLVEMKKLLHREFPQIPNFIPHFDEKGIDLSCATLDGAYGAMLISLIYGLKVSYYKDNWPSTDTHENLPLETLQNLKPFDLDSNPAFQELMGQMDTIESHFGKISGYLNYQGVLNNAMRLRGQDIFMDMYDDPDFVHFLFDHIANTMIETVKRVQSRQRASGFPINLLSNSNCVINMISSDMYEEFVLPYDIKISKEFERFGIHTCNWNATPYIDSLRKIPKMGYIDMGMDTDMKRMKEVFPDARRAVLYSPVKIEELSLEEITADLKKIRDDISPCDIVLADIESTTPEDRVRDVLEIVRKLDTGEL